MVIIIWILFGALTGWVTSLIISEHANYTIARDIALGIAGAIVGGLLAQRLGLTSVHGFDAMSLLLAIVGALIVIMLVNNLQRG